MAYNPRDFYFKKAKKEHFAARSVFKLEEIDGRFKILKRGMRVLDLGAAPGSWAQYTSLAVGAEGKILGIDLKSVQLSLPNVCFVKADLLMADLDAIFKSTGILPPFDVVLSDMAPSTTGIRVTDQARSLELCQLALTIAKISLKGGGSFVCKLFHGEGFEDFRRELRECFSKVDILRPKSTRKESKEIFFICQGRQGN